MNIYAWWIAQSAGRPIHGLKLIQTAFLPVGNGRFLDDANLGKVIPL